MTSAEEGLRTPGIRVARGVSLAQPFDLLLSDCMVVSSHEVRREDVGIRDGRVVALGDLERAKASDFLNASGLFALPGLVDAHVHPTYLDDPRDCSIAALCGGITTALFFAYPQDGESLVAAVHALRNKAAGSCFIDFGLHATLFDASSQAHEIPSVAALGVRTFKVFLAYAAEGRMSDDFELARVMQAAARVGGLLLAHCENGAAIDVLERDSVRDGSGDAITSLETIRPPLLEAEAIHRLISLGEVFGCPVFIVHVSSTLAVEVVRQARARGAAVAAETCPHYLALTAQAVEQWGALAKIAPPLRSEVDRQSLWRGVRDRSLQTIGSDHAPKKTPATSGVPLSQAGFGAPSLETMLPVVYDTGVAGGQMPVTRLVELMSENPARIFGLWPAKGRIAPGADADLVLWDPAGTTTVAAERMHTRSNYSLYEGRLLQGRHVATILRGHVLARAGELVDDTCDGRFLPTRAGDLMREDTPRKIDV